MRCQNPTQDGTAILWRECLAHESTASPGTAADLITPAATAAPKASGGHGRQLVPSAIMRGHSGAHVWRLAVHEFGPCSVDHDDRSSGICGTPIGSRAIAERGPGRGLVVMATGGNDGAAKLWDLEFEATCESGNGRESRWEVRLCQILHLITLSDVLELIDLRLHRIGIWLYRIRFRLRRI